MIGRPTLRLLCISISYICWVVIDNISGSFLTYVLSHQCDLIVLCTYWLWHVARGCCLRRKMLVPASKSPILTFSTKKCLFTLLMMRKTIYIFLSHCPQKHTVHAANIEFWRRSMRVTRLDMIQRAMKVGDCQRMETEENVTLQARERSARNTYGLVKGS